MSEYVGRTRPGTPARLAKLLFLLCAFDATATDFGIRLLLVDEANPFARALYEADAALFYGWKLGLPLALYALIVRMGEHPTIYRLLVAVILVYGAVAIYHIGLIVYFLMH